MKLRGRFTLWFAIAALVPIAAATLVTREVLSRSYRRQFDDERTSAVDKARRLVSDLQDSVEARVHGLASPDNLLVGGLLLELEKADGDLPPVERRKLAEQGRILMASLDLDVLYVLDHADAVLAAPHNRGVVGAVRPDLRRRAAHTGGDTYFALEPTIQGDTMEASLAALSARTVRDHGQSVTVLGGQSVAQELITPLRDSRRVDARIVERGGKILVPPKRSWSTGAPGTAAATTPGTTEQQGSVARVPLPGADGRAVAWVEVRVSDAELAQLQREVAVASFVLGGAALLLTTIFGFVLSRRFTRDLDALVAGARAVGRDDYEHRIEVRSRDEVGAVADSFNAMLADLQESKERLITAERIAAWQDIARSLAHEIKNPLTPIQMSVETMRRSHAKAHPSFEEIFEESTATILEETARLGRIVSEFSEFARMPKPSKQPTDLNEVVRSAAALYKGSVALECDFDESVPLIEADRDQLTQVLLNLLENSRDAIAGIAPGIDGHDQGRIVVQTRLSLDGRSVELLVADNGPGIASEMRGKIFTPYFTTKGQRGTGLGLATVHRIVSDHGGRVRAGESTMGGAELVIALPAGRSTT